MLILEKSEQKYALYILRSKIISPNELSEVGHVKRPIFGGYKTFKYNVNDVFLWNTEMNRESARERGEVAGREREIYIER